MYTEFQDLSPEKLFNIFKKLISYSEFDRKLLNDVADLEDPIEESDHELDDDSDSDESNEKDGH